MIDVGLYSLKRLRRERVGLGEHPLGAVVLILAVFVFKKHGVASGQHHHIDSESTDVVDRLHLRLRHRRDELEIGVRVEIVDAVGKIKRCAARHLHFRFRRDDLVERYMSDTTDFFHSQIFIQTAH